MSVAPTVDVSALCAGSDAGTAHVDACDDALYRACVRTGFFVAVGHGLDAELAAILDAARQFFAQPQTVKESTPRQGRYGYVPHAGSAIDTERQSFNTEYLDLGLAEEVRLPRLDGFEPAVRQYQAAALGLGRAILGSLARALRLAPDFFEPSMVDPQCRLRFLHYPEVGALPDGSLPVPTAPHTDYGLITLLATDGVPGLEVKPIDGKWSPVETPPEGLVVNLGDMLARWSNDVFRSTPHRVVGPRSGDRFSIPFFVNPNPGTVIDGASTWAGRGRPCKYEPVTAGEFLAMRIDGGAEPYVDPDEGPARSAQEATS